MTFQSVSDLEVHNNVVDDVRQATVKEDIALSVSPNPASAFLDVSFTDSDTQYRLTSSTGQVVQQGVVIDQNMRLDLGDLPSGLYFMMTNSTESPVKIVVTK